LFCPAKDSSALDNKRALVIIKKPSGSKSVSRQIINKGKISFVKSTPHKGTVARNSEEVEHSVNDEVKLINMRTAQFGTDEDPEKSVN
jgi:hypothetical protein